MHRLQNILVLPFLALAGVACGGTGTQTTGPGTASSSSGMATSSSGASTSTGAGTGGASTTSSAASSGSTGGAGTGGAAPCVGHIDLAIDNKALQHFTAECKGDTDASQWTTPVGYLFAGNLPGQPYGLRIVGCKTSAANSEGVVLDALHAAGTGTYTMGTPQYTDANGVVTGTGADPFNMVVSAFGPTGQPIDGTFTATSGAHALTGSFHVCHGGDLMPP